MAKEIVILDVDTSANDVNVNYSFWLYPPTANQQYYTKSATTKPAFVRATAQEITDFQNGVFIELNGNYKVPSGWTQAQIAADLQSRWTAANTAFQALQSMWTKYGIFWDGTSWLTA